MTRADDLRWKTRLCLLAKQHFGLFGSEEGREWAVPCSDYLEGLFNSADGISSGQRHSAVSAGLQRLRADHDSPEPSR